ncbi:flavodoxin family protein [Acetobacter sp. AN02]|uniref:flavodoxin family protein n=1 Tax=Acetobacter sp. AN02 TaxID=2894186 RepID=UPI0024344B82|nr:flavodoxin family protein [Acetobacter sp. AN02]MDG6094351.1 flavodoxin family protein [Acetobacter sp. AN02]
MSGIAVVYHSGYGHTKRIAGLVAEGAGAALIEIDAQGEISAEGWDTLNAAKTIVFGSPTYMGNSSWQFRKFAEATSKIWYTRGWQNKLFAGFSNSASPVGDKTLTIESLQILASQHGGVWISLGMLPSNTKAATSADVNQLGGSVGLLVQSPSDASVDEIPEGGLKTAVEFGRRIAEVSGRYTLA